ncbi:hypothetical protein HWV62_31817 [Athelia sp. TMB]|nr:hypothetical protein HWV62_31817 [Athelia sp. TMB]
MDIVNIEQAVVVYVLARRTATNEPLGTITTDLPTSYVHYNVSQALVEYANERLKRSVHVMNSVPAFAEMIVPGSEIYERNLHITTINAVISSPAIFVWTVLPKRERRKRTARYCVYFFSQAGPPFSAMAAGYAFMSFADRWRHIGRHIEIQQAAMVIDETGTWGVMTFPEEFKTVYETARQRGAAFPDKYRSPDGAEVVTTWPEDKANKHLRTPRMVERVMHTGR